MRNGEGEKWDHSLNSEIQVVRIEDYGEFGLIIDNEHLGKSEKSGTVRSERKHQLHDPLFDPGTADLTADLDFKRVKFVIEIKDPDKSKIERWGSDSSSFHSSEPFWRSIKNGFQ